VNHNAYRLELPREYEVHTTFSVTNLIPFIGGTNDEANTSDLRLNPPQEGGDDEIHLAKGQTTKVIPRRIQEEWASFEHIRHKLRFI